MGNKKAEVSPLLHPGTSRAPDPGPERVRPGRGKSRSGPSVWRTVAERAPRCQRGDDTRVCSPPGRAAHPVARPRPRQPSAGPRPQLGRGSPARIPVARPRPRQPRADPRPQLGRGSPARIPGPSSAAAAPRGPESAAAAPRAAPVSSRPARPGCVARTSCPTCTGESSGCRRVRSVTPTRQMGIGHEPDAPEGIAPGSTSADRRGMSSTQSAATRLVGT